MLLTRESDYALRVIRALKAGEKRSVKDICGEEDMPEPFTYKILKKLEKAEIVTSIRGAQGGYILAKEIKELSLMDVVEAIDSEFGIIKCTKKDCTCHREHEAQKCTMHQEFNRIQNVLINEFREKTLEQVFEAQ